MKSVKVETVQKMLIELGFRGPTFRGAYIVFRLLDWASEEQPTQSL
jgi:hypothetical protein